MIIYFVGGGDYRKKELQEIDRSIAKYINYKNNQKFLVVPFATKKEKYDKWFNSLKENYKEMGFTFDMLNEADDENISAKKIESSEVVFFTGGRPEKLIEISNKKNIIEAIKKHKGIIIGYSAGALALCKDCVIIKDEDYPKSIVIPGLNIVDFSTSVHYEETHDKDLLKLSKKRKIFALPNKSALIFRDSKISFIGPAFLFYEKNKKVL